MDSFSLSDYVDLDRWDAGDYMAATCCIVNIFIFTPIMTIYAYKYSKRRNQSQYFKYFKTRNIILIKFWMLCNFYYVSIHSILLFIIQFKFEDASWTDYFSDFAIISFIFFLFVLRVWKLYFDYMWSMSQLDLIWKRQINKQYSNWYLSHKNFGSAKFCFFVILLPIYAVLNGSL